MRKIVKMLVYSPLAFTALLVSSFAVSPASILNLYQPTPPTR